VRFFRLLVTDRVLVLAFPRPPVELFRGLDVPPGLCCFFFLFFTATTRDGQRRADLSDPTERLDRGTSPVLL
jgi:hypothetical protein